LFVYIYYVLLYDLLFQNIRPFFYNLGESLYAYLKNFDFLLAKKYSQ